MEQQRYDNGFTNDVYCKIIRPIKLADGSTETIISQVH